MKLPGWIFFENTRKTLSLISYQKSSSSSNLKLSSSWSIWTTSNQRLKGSTPVRSSRIFSCKPPGSILIWVQDYCTFCFLFDLLETHKALERPSSTMVRNDLTWCGNARCAGLAPSCLHFFRASRLSLVRGEKMATVSQRYVFTRVRWIWSLFSFPQNSAFYGYRLRG